ncbi:MAG: hypothetical protein HQK50_05090 [Oligoflexia bacterium]|nr:hypothetical protein [Oligoflexia bacterium]MBF0364923.1 hypothetical protein [Oligoflexia bacterium]
MNTNIFQSYLYLALTPLSSHQELRQKNIEVEKPNFTTSSLLEFIFIAWFFLFLYEFVDLYLLSLKTLSAQEKSAIIFGKTIFLIVFPLYALFAAYLFSKFLYFIGSYAFHRKEGMQSEEFLHYEDTRLKQGVDQVTSSLFCAYLFLPIPVIGVLLHQLALLYYLLIGLKKNLQFSKTEIASVVLIPLFIFLTFIVVISSITLFSFITLQKINGGSL